MYGVVYKATNTITNEGYVGQTKDFEKRKQKHLYQNFEKESNFQKAIYKYGWSNFEWEVICECNTKEELDEMEYHYIQQYKDIGLYNIIHNKNLKSVSSVKCLEDEKWVSNHKQELSMYEFEHIGWLCHKISNKVLKELLKEGEYGELVERMLSFLVNEHTGQCAGGFFGDYFEETVRKQLFKSYPFLLKGEYEYERSISLDESYVMFKDSQEAVSVFDWFLVFDWRDRLNEFETRIEKWIKPIGDIRKVLGKYA